MRWQGEWCISRFRTATATGPGRSTGFINGGMFERTEALRGPVLTIDVDDLDAALKTVESLGGKQVGEKLPVGDMGFAAYFEDPEGNILGLWQSA